MHADQTPAPRALLKKAIRAFPHTAHTPKALRRSNQRKWLAAVAALGDRWIALPINRPNQEMLA